MKSQVAPVENWYVVDKTNKEVVGMWLVKSLIQNFNNIKLV